MGLHWPGNAEPAALAETKKDQNNRVNALSTLRAVYAHGIDVYASFVVGFDADDASIFDRQYEFIVESGIVVASLGLLLALPRTPLHERLQREGRLKLTAGEGHHLWNNLIATNIAPLRMTEEELLGGFRDLMGRLSDDAAIAQRIRNKLRILGRPPIPFGLSVPRTLLYLLRFLVRGILPGGPRRWYHFIRSLGTNPRLVPFVVLNWTYGLAIQAFVRKHLSELATEKSGVADRLPNRHPAPTIIAPSWQYSTAARTEPSI